jgi:CrcB protein
MNMISFLLVFLGGGLGSLFRYTIGLLLKPISPQLPLATLIANTIGCLFLGLLMGFLSTRSSVSNTQHMLLAVGFCGGLTTFSTFTLENMRFIEQGQFFNFFIYSIGTFTLGIACIYAGMLLHKQF